MCMKNHAYLHGWIYTYKSNNIIIIFTIYIYIHTVDICGYSYPLFKVLEYVINVIMCNDNVGITCIMGIGCVMR